MKVLGPVSQPISPLAATSPVRGSQSSSLTENGVAVCFSSRSRADVGSGVNAIESSAKKSRNESRMPFVFAVLRELPLRVRHRLERRRDAVLRRDERSDDKREHARGDGFPADHVDLLATPFAVIPRSVSGFLNFSCRLRVFGLQCRPN